MLLVFSCFGVFSAMLASTQRPEGKCAHGITPLPLPQDCASGLESQWLLHMGMKCAGDIFLARERGVPDLDGPFQPEQSLNPLPCLRVPSQPLPSLCTQAACWGLLCAQPRLAGEGAASHQLRPPRMEAPPEGGRMLS